jgi:hypothetical protein
MQQLRKARWVAANPWVVKLDLKCLDYLKKRWHALLSYVDLSCENLLPPLTAGPKSLGNRTTTLPPAYLKDGPFLQG